MKSICILGSTGSIGTQTLDIIRQRRNDFNIVALSTNSNIELLYNQAIEFKPSFVVAMTEDGCKVLKEKLINYDIKVLCGVDGLEYISTIDDADIVLTSVVGMIGLRPTISAIKAGKIIALANKETMVAGGDIVINELKSSSANIIPVDSEHSALFQCMNGEIKSTIKRLVLTASGGPFRRLSREQLTNVTPEMALKHPKWNMGKKISIDSATLMNKALEVIEAHWLFGIDYNKIDVIIHPQSIVHSMVEYLDGSIIAQLGNTDMKHPIQYALDYPQRKTTTSGYLDLVKHNNLTFETPDIDTFECLSLGYKAGKIGGTMTTVLNAANEEAVKLFLSNKIGFLQIGEIVKEAMNQHKVLYNASLEKILEVESATREYVNKLIK